jgi:hypothetical protein
LSCACGSLLRARLSQGLGLRLGLGFHLLNLGLLRLDLGTQLADALAEPCQLWAGDGARLIEGEGLQPECFGQLFHLGSLRLDLAFQRADLAAAVHLGPLAAYAVNGGANLALLVEPGEQVVCPLFDRFNDV